MTDYSRENSTSTSGGLIEAISKFTWKLLALVEFEPKI